MYNITLGSYRYNSIQNAFNCCRKKRGIGKNLKQNMELLMKARNQKDRNITDISTKKMVQKATRKASKIQVTESS